MFAAKKRIPFPPRQTISNLHQRTWAVMRTEAKDSFSHYFLQCALREKPTCLLCLYISLLVHHSPHDFHLSCSDFSSFRSHVSSLPPHLISIHPDSAICAHKPITTARCCASFVLHLYLISWPVIPPKEATHGMRFLPLGSFQPRYDHDALPQGAYRL